MFRKRQALTALDALDEAPPSLLARSRSVIHLKDFEEEKLGRKRRSVGKKGREDSRPPQLRADGLTAVT